MVGTVEPQILAALRETCEKRNVEKLKNPQRLAGGDSTDIRIGFTNCRRTLYWHEKIHPAVTDNTDPTAEYREFVGAWSDLLISSVSVAAHASSNSKAIEQVASGRDFRGFNLASPQKTEWIRGTKVWDAEASSGK